MFNLVSKKKYTNKHLESHLSKTYEVPRLPGIGFTHQPNFAHLHKQTCFTSIHVAQSSSAILVCVCIQLPCFSKYVSMYANISKDHISYFRNYSTQLHCAYVYCTAKFIEGKQSK